MSWIALAFSAALSWGLYGASLHRGQVALGNPMKAMLCVGVAYFLIAVLVLFWMGSGPIRGFATTLTIGILASMFTAVTVTRLMVSYWLRWARPQVIPI